MGTDGYYGNDCVGHVCTILRTLEVMKFRAFWTTILVSLVLDGAGDFLSFHDLQKLFFQTENSNLSIAAI